LVGEHQIFIKSEYFKKVYSFSILSNTIYEHYFPLFLKFGPRSRIFENLINGFINIDIRIFSLSKGLYFPLLEFYLPFFSLVPVFIIIIILWRKEIFSLLLRHKRIILILISCVLSISFLVWLSQPIRTINFQKEWYPVSPGEDFRWMRNNGTIILYNEKNVAKNFLFTFDTISNIVDREVDVYLNNQKIDSFWSLKGGNKIHVPVILKSGSNILELKTSEPCLKSSPDIRCISIGIVNFSINEPKEGILFSKGWYPVSPGEDFRWMRNNGTILIYNKEYSKTSTFEIELFGYFRNRKIIVLFNKEIIDDFILKHSMIVDKKFYLKLKLGLNILEFYSSQKCDVVKEVEYLPDFRCLNLAIKKLKIV